MLLLPLSAIFTFVRDFHEKAKPLRWLQAKPLGDDSAEVFGFCVGIYFEGLQGQKTQ